MKDTFSQRDIELIIANAAATEAKDRCLQDIELQRAAQRETGQLALTSPSERTHALAIAKAIGAEYGLAAETIDRAFRRWHPSIEEQLRQIEKIRAEPSIKGLCSTYVSILGEDIKEAIAGESNRRANIVQGKSYSGSRSWYTARFGIDTLRDQRGLLDILFRSPILEERSLAEMKFERISGGKTINISIYDPVFLSICGDSLEKLNEYARKYATVNCKTDYPSL